MTGEVEAAGDLVTGGLIATAVEPGGGTRTGTQEGACLNCGTALAGFYCHSCGQPAHLHRSLGALWHDIAHGVLHFEGKIWRTLPLLAWHPGDLTRRYIHGERARFVSPMALFLFSVFLMFAVISLFGGHLETGAMESPDRARTIAALDAQAGKARAELATVESALRAAKAAGADTRELDDRREALNATIATTTVASAGISASGAPESLNLKSRWPTLDHGIQKAWKNPNLLLYKIQTNAYKFSWALIPISIPFLWLLFAWRREFKLYDHAIFVIYSLSFMTLMVAVLTIGGSLGLPSAIIGIAAMLVPPAHMYRQLRGAYGLSRLSAVIRTCALILFAGIAVTLFVLLLLAMGLLG